MNRLFIAAALAVATSPSYPREDAQDAIVVTATRLGAASAAAPANVSVISAEDIARSPAQTLPDLLAREAGVFTRSLFGNQAARATVDLRGFGATGTQNTLVLLDGRRLNDIDLSGVDFAALPLDNIERIEVVRSGGAVLYGDGTAGGSINIITKGPGPSGSSGSAAAALGSHDTRSALGTYSHTAADRSLRLFASRVTSDGYRDNNSLRQTTVQGDLRAFGERGQWFVKFGGDQQDLGLPGARAVNPALGLNELASDRRGTSTPDDFAEQRGLHVTVGTSQYLEGGGELIVDGGVRHKRQEAFLGDYEGLPALSLPPGTFSNFVDTRLDNWSLTPRVSLPLQGSGVAHTLTAGVDLYYSDYQSDRGQRADTPAIHRLKVTQRSLAVYARDVLSLTPADELTLGLRLQRVWLSSRDRYDPSAPGQPFGGNQAAPLDRADTEPMLELGLRHDLTPHWSAFAKLERSVRFSTVDEVFEFNPDLAVQEFSPLDPQRATHLDVGADFHRGGTRLSGAAYYMHIEDEIHLDAATFSNVNLDPTRRYGLELSARHPLTERWSLGVAYAHARAQFRKGPFADNDVPLVPRNSASLSLEWRAAPGLELSGLVRYVGKQRMDNDQANAQRSIPAYTLVDVKAARRWKHWELELQLNNALDEKAFAYAVASTFTPGAFNAYPLPERTASMTVRYRY